jgi:hypothetical protein
MIKLFRNLSEDEIRNFLSKEFSIVEKLDMIYFKVSVNHLGVFALKSPKYTAVSDIDCICNSVYNNIVMFANSLNRFRSDILSMYGECTLGFFYLPVHKTKIIDYYTIDEGTMILSDIFLETKSVLPKSEILTNIYNMFCEERSDIINSPGISIEVAGDDLIEDVISLLREGKDDTQVIKMILSYFDVETMSGLRYDEIEGLILRNNKEQYQLIANNTDTQLSKGVKKMYRDIVLSHLANDIVTDDYIHELFNSKKTYIEKVCKVFLDFVNVTDVFTKYKFDEEDFLPPMSGYFGDLEIDAIPIEDVKTICKVNKVSRNILRMLLHTFTHPVSNNKFADLPDEDATKLNMLTIALKYKNFAELALHSA